MIIVVDMFFGSNAKVPVVSSGCKVEAVLSTWAIVANVGMVADIDVVVFKAVVAVIPAFVAVVASVESVLVKDVLEAPYKKS